jgi:hypothetical protein
LWRISISQIKRLNRVGDCVVGGKIAIADKEISYLGRNMDLHFAQSHKAGPLGKEPHLCSKFQPAQASAEC